MSLESVAAQSPTAFEAAFADERAFQAWYEQMLPRVYGYLLNRCGRNSHTAEELTQETFVEAIKSRRSFNGPDSAAWLIGIARHRLLDHLRRESRREIGLLRVIARTQPQVVWLGSEEPDDALAASLQRLPATQRAAVILRYVDDLPVRDVARLLGRSEGAVESLLSRGRETLRREYGGVDR